MLKDYISRCHLDLSELFLLHQEALLLERLDDAGDLLDCYGRCLALHMEQEERHLFPLYGALPQQGRWSVDLYRKEHDRIRSLLAGIVGALAGLAGAGLDGRQRRRNVLALLDREKTLRGLLEHHEDREEASMFPLLDRHGASTVHEEILRRLADPWRRQIESVESVIARICASWPSQPRRG